MQHRLQLLKNNCGERVGGPDQKSILLVAPLSNATSVAEEKYKVQEEGDKREIKYLYKVLQVVYNNYNTIPCGRKCWSLRCQVRVMCRTSLIFNRRSETVSPKRLTEHRGVTPSDFSFHRPAKEDSREVDRHGDAPDKPFAPEKH